MTIKYELVAELPSVEDYCRLRVVAGLAAKAPKNATAALPHTCYAVVVKTDDKVIGMGRVVGDGALFLLVCDIAVEPQYQGQGIGKAIMRNITDYINENFKGSYVSLIADGDAKHLYAQYGFEPVTPESIGMAYMVEG